MRPLSPTARSQTVLEELLADREFERSVDQVLDEAIESAAAPEHTTVTTVLRYELACTTSPVSGIL